MLSKVDVIDAINEFLPSYEYEYNHPYEVGDGVYDIVNTWYDNKADTSIFRTLEKHPNYNGRFQIVLDETFHRSIDKSEVRDFITWMIEKMDFQEGEDIIYDDTETPLGVRFLYGKQKRIRCVYGDDSDYDNTFILMTIDRTKCHPVDGREVITAQQYNAFRDFALTPTQYLHEYMLETINNAFPWLKAHDGAKASKVFRRICKECGLDKYAEFDKMWPRFADSVNPLGVKRWTIISWNPIDFFTMSFGNDWQSCHTIDKTGKRGVGGDHYHGCYSSGTMSYMLDGSSVVVYTVDKSYNGNEFEYQPKMTRQMFHISEDIMVQGRLYPQGNDVGAEEAYQTMRNIVQRVYSEAFGVSNMWTIKRGTDECCDVICTDDDATHYRDYECFENCTVSKRKEWGGQMIEVGHAPICPLCGCEHSTTENIMCDDCRDVKRCECCDARITSCDYIEAADGSIFCDAYCAENAGYVYCENADDWYRYDDDDTFRDDYNGEYYHTWDYITTEDGHNYYNEEHAREDGYEYVDRDDEWYPSDEVRYCEHCDEYVHENDWDDELGMCENCAREIERDEVVS